MKRAEELKRKKKEEKDKLESQKLSNDRDK